MAAEGSPFILPINHLLQLGGSYRSKGAVQAGAAAVVINSDDGCIQQIKADSAVSAAVAVTCTNPPAGLGNSATGNLQLILTASGAGTVTFTLGTGFKVTGTAAPTTGKNIVIEFVSDGTNWLECGRPSAAV